jgi:hypothetical protein
MNNLEEPAQTPASDPDDRYSSPNALLRLASWAYGLSWVVLILDTVLFIGRLVFQYMEGMTLDVLTVFTQLFYLSSLLGGIIWFVVLQALSHGIYLWLDIEDNTH